MPELEVSRGRRVTRTGRCYPLESDGGAPDTHQRNTVHNDIFDGKSTRAALLTNALANPVKRGIARALT